MLSCVDPSKGPNDVINPLGYWITILKNKLFLRKIINHYVLKQWHLWWPQYQLRCPLTGLATGTWLPSTNATQLASGQPLSSILEAYSFNLNTNITPTPHGHVDLNLDKSTYLSLSTVHLWLKVLTVSPNFLKMKIIVPANIWLKNWGRLS